MGRPRRRPRRPGRTRLGDQTGTRAPEGLVRPTDQGMLSRPRTGTKGRRGSCQNERMRLAWFSPMPPVRSGIATCSAELVAALAGEHQVDVYVDSGFANPAAGAATAGASAGQAQLRHDGVRSAHDFVWRQRQRPYDLTVYQLGNSSHHDYLWPYLFRYPGLAVLHDAHLHHARAAALLRTRRAGDYRAEFAANHPDASADAAELAVAGFDNHLYYSWPMTRLVVLASRTTAVHARPIAAALREEWPGGAIEPIRLAQGMLVGAEAVADARARVRRARGIPDDARAVRCLRRADARETHPADSRRARARARVCAVGAPAPRRRAAAPLRCRRRRAGARPGRPRDAHPLHRQ